jgi:membrane-associated HD superfamily phosphohydrolase
VYFLKPISDEVRLSQIIFNKHKKTFGLILVSIFACISAILQAAGGFLPGIGYFLSPLATAPILLCSMFSIPFGVMSYFLTIILLFFLQPTELIVFPFTTGLLGLGIGASFYFFRKRLSIIASGTMLLMLGIISLLFIFHFPVLGPAVPDSFSFLTTGCIFLFAFLYSWLWVEMALIIHKRLKTIII